MVADASIRPCARLSVHAALPVMIHSDDVPSLVRFT